MSMNANRLMKVVVERVFGGASTEDIMNQLALYKGYGVDRTVSDYDDRKEKFDKGLEIACNNRSVGKYATIIKIMLYLNPWHSMHLMGSKEGRQFSYKRDGRSARTRSRFGRIIRRQLKVPFEIIGDSALSKIGEIIQEVTYPMQNMVGHYEGYGIHDVYSEYRGESCMSGDDYCASFIDFYSHNKDVVSVLSVWEDCYPTSKALLWETDQGDLFLDRVYLEDEYEDMIAIRAKARNIGAFVGDHMDCAQEGTGHTVTVDITDIEYLPYMDSFYMVVENKEENGRILSVLTNTCELRGVKGALHSLSGDGIRVCKWCDKKQIAPNLDNECFSCGNHLNGKECFLCKNVFDQDDMTTAYQCGQGVRHVCEECRRNDKIKYCEYCGTRWILLSPYGGVCPTCA
jgi:hypothetical protein